jgi:hypothetical protein
MLLRAGKTVTRPTRSNETSQCLASQLSQRAGLFPVAVLISNKGGLLWLTFCPRLSRSFLGLFSFDLSVCRGFRNAFAVLSDFILD